MKLSFLKSYRSIDFLPDIELPDFVVLTGVNGAGKSHLLESITNGSTQIDNIEVNNQTQSIRLFTWTNLIPQDSGAFAPYQITQERSGLWSEISNYKKEYRLQISQILQQFNLADLDKLKTREIIELKTEDFIARGKTPDQANQIFESIQSAASAVNHRFIQNNDQPNRQRLVNLFKSDTNMPLIALEEDDFYNSFPRSWKPVDMFQQSFGRLFSDYQRNLLNNDLKYLAHLKGKSVSFLTEKEFLNKYGEPPWEFVNTVLGTANLDFRINQPIEHEDRPYEPILTDTVRKTQVKFNDLSSGERVLMSFALCLYYAGDSRQIVDYPKVLLFDEIDAPLHPSMTQSLLRTIQDVLVNRHGIKVILTTHSPSTVALAPEDSLYAMYKSDQERIQKTTKDKALSILTIGVPTLSIDYENRRQVFVESSYDAQFYERIYEKLRDHLIQEISLNFLPSGVRGNGNCDQVKDVVNQLQKGGSRTVYGIIDWDLTNFGNERIKVLGKEKRYSIENYILDPVLVAAFLLREKWIERCAIGMSDHETYIHFATFDDARLQRIADFVVNKVKARISPVLEDDNLPCKYLSGQIINLPKWFLKIQGHQLEKDLKEIFQELKRFQKESQLKSEIINKVVDDVPSLIPYDLVDLFKEIQKIS
jgi:AAA15 family ATPase/GTPase